MSGIHCSSCHDYFTLKWCTSALPVKYTVHASTTTAPVTVTALRSLCGIRGGLLLCVGCCCVLRACGFEGREGVVGKEGRDGRKKEREGIGEKDDRRKEGREGVTIMKTNIFMVS